HAAAEEFGPRRDRRQRILLLRQQPPERRVIPAEVVARAVARWRMPPRSVRTSWINRSRDMLARSSSIGSSATKLDLLKSRSPSPHSHSIVAGGFELTSYTTRFTPSTSLAIRLDTRDGLRPRRRL